ncbi:MAG: hypothetical protein ACI3W5_16225 [Faecousia sp.]
MSVTTIAMVINIGAGMAVWQSQQSAGIKMLIIAMLLGKYALFFHSVWISQGEQRGKLEVTVCIVWNAVIMIYAFTRQEWLLVFFTAVLLILLLIWAFAVVYDFPPKAKRK